MITCGDEPMVFLKVDPDTKKLEATQNIEEAEEFTVKVFSDCHSGFEFSIASTLTVCKGKSIQSSDPNEHIQKDGNVSVLPMEYYLETSVNFLTGRGDETPKMRINTDYRQMRMVLKKRINHRISCDTKHWRKGREAYYIECIHLIFNGYFCVKKLKTDSATASKSTGSDEEPTKYEVCVEPSVDSHSDKDEVFMLFRLLPASCKTHGL